jgi:hypothetical protein
MSADDPGKPQRPGDLRHAKILWERSVASSWWRNSHRFASDPMVFSKALARFSGPTLPFYTLYLGSTDIVCFWECGLGRDLVDRYLSDRTISSKDLEDRIEYEVLLESTALATLKIFNASDDAARRSAGAKSSASFLADHDIAREWARALHVEGAGGIMYPSARSSTGVCLALFSPTATSRIISDYKKSGSSYTNPRLLAQLITESVTVLRSVS